MNDQIITVYPCTYRELMLKICQICDVSGISLYLQGTQWNSQHDAFSLRYIPVPTGNSLLRVLIPEPKPVYPCTYRELI